MWNWLLIFLLSTKSVSTPSSVLSSSERVDCIAEIRDGAEDEEDVLPLLLMIFSVIFSQVSDAISLIADT
jgi:hypothetical protein